MSKIPALVSLVVFACAIPVDAAPPVISFLEGSAAVITMPPGHGIALYASGVAGGARSWFTSYGDSDGDGRVVHTFGPMAYMSVVAVDMVTGEYSYAAFGREPDYRPLPAGSIVAGPDGAYTQLVLPPEIIYPMWVRPGVGMWVKTGAYVDDDDDVWWNDYQFVTTSSFREVAPTAPASFQKGDVFVCVSRANNERPDRIYVERVDRHLDAQLPGVVSFVDPGEFKMKEGETVTPRLMRVGGSSGALTVRVRTAGSNGAADIDYKPVDELVTFQSGEVFKYFSFTALEDAFYAGNVRVTFEVSDASNAPSGPHPQRDAVIVSNEAMPVAAFGALPASVQEGDAPWTLNVPLTLTGLTRVPAVGSYKTKIGDIAEQGQLTFAPGETVASIGIAVPADAVPGPNRTISITIDALKDVAVQNGYITIPLIDDDAATIVVPDDRYVSETGQNVVLVMQVSGYTPPGATVTYQTVDGTARAGSDYAAKSGAVSATSYAQFTISLLDDNEKEPSVETFHIDLTANTGALSRQRITILIWDDESSPVPVVHAASAVEGGRFETLQVPVKVTLPSPAPVRLTGSATILGKTATYYDDFMVTSKTEFTFEPGETETTFPVWIKGDSLEEPDETIGMTVSFPRGDSSSAIFTIIDDDTPGLPLLTVLHHSLLEGNSGLRDAEFELTLSQPMENDGWVDVETMSGTATANTDFVAAAQRIPLARGATGATFTVSVLSDDRVEGDETFTLRLASPHVIVPASAPVCTIVNDDQAARKRAVRH
jgi:Calx-beta domain